MIVLDTATLLAITDGTLQREDLQGQRLAVSAISQLAILGDTRLRADEVQLLKRLFTEIDTIDISDNVVSYATSLRQMKSGLSLHDSLVAASAYVHGLTLWTITPESYQGVAVLVQPLQGR